MQGSYPDERVTVAFTLASLERLARPGLVFGETKGWARAVGIVSDRPVYAQTGFARDHGIDFGFHSGSHGLRESLAVIRQRPEQAADRYLLIGASLDAEEVGTRGWDYVELAEVAEARGWDLEDTAEDEAFRGWGD